MSSQVAAALRDMRRASTGSGRSGAWVGRVESIDDPRRLGRARVRVFHIHGDNRSTPTEALPWAEVADFGGGGYDYGSGGRVYPVGSTVWVVFEMGEEEYPVIVGGRRGIAERDDKNPVEFQTVGGQDDSTTEQAWLPPEGNENPKDIFDADNSADGDQHPTRVVWQKSFRGHTILVEDREGHEFLRIIDRAGQVIEMDCPVLEEENENNAAQRGTRSAVDDNQLTQDQLVNGRAFIRLKDLAGQEVVLDAARNGEEIRLTSRNRQGTSVQKAVFSSAKGRERIELSDKQGNTFLMDPNSSTPLRIFDYAGDEVQWDTENGVLRVIAVNQFEEGSAGTKTQVVGGNKTVTVVGDDQLRCLGNKFVEVMNDLTSAIAGATNVVCTGALDVQVVNQSMSGAPASTAANLLATLGDLNFQTLAGAATVGAPLGVSLEGVFPSTTKESAALGDSIASALQELHDVFANNAAAFGIGNLGAPVPINPAVITALLAWVTKYVSVPATNVVSAVHTVSRL